MGPRSRSSLALIALAVFFAASARAQPVSPASQPSSQPASQSIDPHRVRAKEHFDRAETQYRLGNFAAALADYQAALRLRRHPSIVFNIAQCYRQLKNRERAIFFYKLFLADWERLNPGTRAPYQNEVERYVLALKEEMRRAEADRRERERRAERLRLERMRSGVGPRPALLRVERITVARAQILIDGIARAVTPVYDAIEVKPGRRRIEVDAPGKLPWSQELELVAGRETRLPVELQAIPRKSRGWLASGVLCSILAAGAEATAVYFYLRANEHFKGTQPFDDDRRFVTLGHAAAGTLAAAAVASFVLYGVSGRLRSERPKHGTSLGLAAWSF